MPSEAENVLRHPRPGSLADGRRGRPPRSNVGENREGVASRGIVASRHAPRDAAIRRTLAIADTAGLVVAFTSLALLGNQLAFSWGLLTIPVWIVLFKAYGLYDRDLKRISHSTLDDLPWIFHAVLLGTLALLAYFHYLPPDVSLAPIALFMATAIAAVPMMRALGRRLARRTLGPERVVLVGEGLEMITLARKLRSHPEYTAYPVGLIPCGPVVGDFAGLPVVGKFAELDLQDLVERHRVDRLIVAHRNLDEQAMFEMLDRSRELGVKLTVVPQLFDALGPSVEVDDVEGITVLGINPPVLPRSSRILKRSLDLVGAAVMLLLTVPVLAIVAIAVKLDSRGPVFFRQQRVGKGGKSFRLVKFRTMTRDAEQQQAHLRLQSKDSGWLLLDHDPRVTRVGRILRLSSLDELPQLWNVLRGEMSLVGPRPIIESEDRQLRGWRRSRVDLTPGITGLWQVLGRTRIPFEEMIKLDYLYVTNWSLWGDVRLILRTLPAVLFRKGAN